MEPAAKAYSLKELADFGIGDRSSIYRKAKKEKFKTISGKRFGKKVTLYLRESLPLEWQQKIDAHENKATLQEMGIETEAKFDPATIEKDALDYANAPDYNRRQFDVKSTILHECEGIVGKELEGWVEKWNQSHPGMETSRATIMRDRKAVKEHGMNALLGKYGTSKGRTKALPEWLEYFKFAYLVEGGSPAKSCWLQVVGKYATEETIDTFPTVEVFTRWLKREVGESAIYYARNGFQKWNRKYAGYIDRDYSKISAGEVWVSDHAQIDIAAESAKNGKPVFGWITSFIDMKTGKALSSFFHEEAPNSDHIFQAFFLAAVAYGLPKYVYIDNGKDYRCRDFAGGKKHYRLEVDETRAKGMLLDLGVLPIFAKPYAAQSKTIERWHLKIKEHLSRNTIGFRGGNVTERPEKLIDEIKKGKLLPFNVLNDIFQDFIFNFLNKLTSQGKGTQGRSPDDIWNLENPVKRMVSRDALKLFCSRTTKPLSIGRNGVKHSQYKVTYFAEWMIPLKGTKVYLRIAPDNVNEAWVFSVDGDEYLGNAQIKGMVHPVAESEIDRAVLRDAIAEKAREEKMAKILGYTTHVPDVTERLSNMKRGAALLNPNPVPEPEQQVQQILPNSPMQQAVAARKRAEQEGKSDLSGLAYRSEIEAVERELESTRGKILHFESDRPAKEEKIRSLELRLQQLKAMGQ